MKKIVSLSCFILLFSLVNAQDYKSKDKASISSKNLVKINLFSLPFRNYSLGFERQVSKKISFGLGYRFMPEGQLPMLSTIKSLVDDPETSNQLDNLYMSNTAISPEIRFYLGKRSMRGFYIAPFSRISKYKISVPFEYEDNNVTESIPMIGELKTFTGGLQFGAQWKLASRIYFDWWLLGPQYGSAKGSISGSKTLTAEEQADLKEELDGLEIPQVETSSTVNSNGARLDIKGPWAGVRAGLSLAFRF